MTERNIQALKMHRNHLKIAQLSIDHLVGMCDHQYADGRCAVTKQGDCTICRKLNLPYKETQ